MKILNCLQRIFLVVLLIAMDRAAVGLNFARADVDTCPTTESLNQVTSASSLVQCSSLCLEEYNCLGFCYNSAQKICKTYTSSDTSDTLWQEETGFNLYFIDGSWGYTRYGHMAYIFIKEDNSYEEAEDLCPWNGGQIAMPMNAEENMAINEISNGDKVWLSAKQNEAGIFVYKGTNTSMASTYTNWSGGRPDGDPGEKPCLKTKDLFWENKKCDENMKVVCQIQIL